MLRKKISAPLAALLCGVLGLAALVRPADAAPPPIGDPCSINPELCIDPCEVNPELCDPCVIDPESCEPDPCAPPDSQPDLKVTDISFIHEGGACFIGVEVTNFGSADAGRFDVDLFVGESMAPEIGQLSTHYQTSAGLAASDTLLLEFEVPAGTSSPANLSALVDSTRQVLESNEGNQHFFRCESVSVSCLL